jgi:hypothetical protein
MLKQKPGQPKSVAKVTICGDVPGHSAALVTEFGIRLHFTPQNEKAEL